MLSWIVLILVLAAFVVLGTWGWGALFGRDEVMGDLDAPRHIIQNNHAALEAGDFGAIEFEVVPRGYRQDQVDALLEEVEQRLRADTVAADAPAADTVAADTPAADTPAAEPAATPTAGSIATEHSANSSNAEN